MTEIALQALAWILVAYSFAAIIFIFSEEENYWYMAVSVIGWVFYGLFFGRLDKFLSRYRDHIRDIEEKR